MICKHCNSQIPDAARFCPVCGTDQSKIIKDEKNPSEAIDNRTVPDQNNSQKVNKSGMKTGMIGGGICIAAGLILVAVFLFMLFGSDSRKTNESMASGEIQQKEEQEDVSTAISEMNSDSSSSSATVNVTDNSSVSDQQVTTEAESNEPYKSFKSEKGLVAALEKNGECMDEECIVDGVMAFSKGATDDHGDGYRVPGKGGIDLGPLNHEDTLYYCQDGYTTFKFTVDNVLNLTYEDLNIDNIVRAKIILTDTNDDEYVFDGEPFGSTFLDYSKKLDSSWVVDDPGFFYIFFNIPNEFYDDTPCFSGKFYVFNENIVTWTVEMDVKTNRDALEQPFSENDEYRSFYSTRNSANTRNKTAGDGSNNQESFPVPGERFQIKSISFFVPEGYSTWTTGSNDCFLVGVSDTYLGSTDGSYDIWVNSEDVEDEFSNRIATDSRYEPITIQAGDVEWTGFQLNGEIVSNYLKAEMDGNTYIVNSHGYSADDITLNTILGSIQSVG